MQCDDVQERLSAFVDDELSSFAAWRLRRHISVCSDCAATQDSLLAIADMGNKYYCSVAAPTSLQSSFVACAQSADLAPPMRYAHNWRRAIGFVSLAVALIGFVVGGVSLYMSLQSTPAYAEVERAMRAAPFRTIHMRVIMGSSEGKYALTTEDLWGRTDHPASISYLQQLGSGRPPSKTTQWPKGMIYRYVFQGKAQKYVRENPVSNRWGDDYYKQWIIDKSMPPEPNSDRNYRWTMTNVSCAGRNLIRFDGVKGFWFSKPSDRGSATMYVDPKTHLLVRSERHFQILGHDSFRICTSIKYDETPPAHTFDDAD